MNTATWLTGQLPEEGKAIFRKWKKQLEAHPDYYAEMTKYAKGVLPEGKYAIWEYQLRLTPVVKRFGEFIKTHTAYTHGQIASSALPPGYLEYHMWYHSQDVTAQLDELRKALYPKVPVEHVDCDLADYIDLLDLDFAPRIVDFIHQLSRRVDPEVLCDFVGTMINYGIKEFSCTYEMKEVCKWLTDRFEKSHGHDMDAWFNYAYPHLSNVRGEILYHAGRKDYDAIQGLVREIRDTRYNEPETMIEVEWLERDIDNGLF